MKVLVQGLVAAPGGSLSVLRDLVAAWPQDDELLILAWRPPAVEALRASGHEVIAVRARSTAEALLRSRPRLGPILRRFRPDVVWSQAVLIGAQRHGPREAIHLRDIGSFVSIHPNSPRRVLKERVERRDLRRADLRILNSRALSDAVVTRYPEVAALPAAIVHNGLDLTPFPSRAPMPRTGAPQLLLAQSDLPHKRNEWAADVLHAVRSADPTLARTTLIVVGAGEYVGLRARAAALGLSSAVTFLGHVARDRMSRAYVEADAVLITSSGESFCNPIIEAHATGRPIVLPPLPVARELEGPMSRIADGDDAAALAAVAVAALLHPPSAQERSGAAAFAAGFTSRRAAEQVRAALHGMRASD